MSIPLAQEEREIEPKDRAFNDMKEIADRAMKLAEIGKKSPLQEVLKWMIRAAIGVGVYLLAK